MTTNDSALYTGLDGEVDGGVFGNEKIDEHTDELLKEQKKLMQELTPQLEGIITMLENERADVIEGIADFIDNSLSGKDVDNSEIRAAARYRKYIDNLKTKFALQLRETKK